MMYIAQKVLYMPSFFTQIRMAKVMMRILKAET